MSCASELRGSVFVRAEERSRSKVCVRHREPDHGFEGEPEPRQRRLQHRFRLMHVP